MATALSRSNQPEGEIESLRRALELSPTWGFASRALALAYERTLQLDAAEHALRRATVADPLDGISLGHLADLLWRRDRKPEALVLMERAIALEPGFEWGWNRLDEWSKTPASSRAVALATSITQTRPGDAQAWLRLARFEEPADAIVTLDRTLALNPRDSDIHDLRAQLLCRLNRHDEARAACCPPAFGDSPPRELQGRAAWVEHAAGQPEEAIRKMRQVVQAHPDYTWGWSCLTQWLWERGELQATLESAAKWAWLVPTIPMPLAYVANAQQRMGRRREAKDALWQALHRDPSYVYAAQTLLKWLAEDHELDDATRLLRHIETHTSIYEAQRSTVFYHIMRLDKPAAAAAFGALARAPVDQHRLVAECAGALTEAGWRRTVEDTLKPLLTEPNINPQIARLWVDSWGADRRWKNLRLLENRATPGPVVREAWSAALEHLGRAGAGWRLRWIRLRRHHWLRAESATWGSMGYALVSAGLLRPAIAWLREWPAMPELKPWMLYNLTLAYYRTKQPDLALSVVQSALKLEADHTHPDFLVWQGIEDALRGDGPAAASNLSRSAAMTLESQPKLLRGFTELLLSFESQRGPNPDEALAEAKRRLSALWKENPWANADNSMVAFRGRVLRYLAGRSGSLLTRIQSRLPPVGRRFTAPANTSVLGEKGWILWIAFVVLSAAFRTCSGQ